MTATYEELDGRDVVFVVSDEDYNIYGIHRTRAGAEAVVEAERQRHYPVRLDIEVHEVRP